MCVLWLGLHITGLAHVQGAAEIVLERCMGYLDAAGQRVAMSEDMRW